MVISAGADSHLESAVGSDTGKQMKGAMALAVVFPGNVVQLFVITGENKAERDAIAITFLGLLWAAGIDCKPLS